MTILLLTALSSASSPTLPLSSRPLALQIQQVSTEEERVEPQLLEAEKAPPPPPKKAIPMLLARIAYCESRNRQFDAEGNVLRGESNPQDIGKYQINLRHWGGKAEEWGHDIFSEEGNEAMALAIFERHGTAPWKWSKKCWQAI